MKKTLIAVVMVMSGAALAGSPQVQAQQPAQGWSQNGWQQQGQGPMQDSPEQQQHREQRKRMMQVVGLTEALGLSTQDALKLDDTIKRFDERRRPLKETVRESAKQVMQAAKGDNAALGQVDQAINRVLDARVQLASLDKEMFQALSAGLAPQQRAKLALFYARMHKAGRAMRGGGFGGGDSEGRFRQMRMRRGGQPMGEADEPSDLGEMADGDAASDISL